MTERNETTDKTEAIDGNARFHVEPAVRQFLDDKHEGGVRQFIQVSKAWYANTSLGDRNKTLDVFNIGIYFEEGGTTGEFSVVWEELCGKFTPRLKCFDDGWSALNEFSDLIKKLALVDGQDISPDQFGEILLTIGIEDRTPIVEKDND